jgi:tellurite resistance protein
MRKKAVLWRRTPPAVFPVSLGLLGLGLGWRNAADVLPVAHEIGDLLLAVATAFFLFFLALYLRKIAARPAVLLEEVASPPARAGLAAASMSMMLLAAALLPFGLSVSEVWWLGVVMQIGASGLGCYAIWRDPGETRYFTPFQYLTFVGPVVGPVAGIPLGHVWESHILTIAALVPYVVITLGFAAQSAKRGIPLVLRPTVAIYLAPNCLFATGFGLLNIDWAFHLLYWVAWVVAAALVPLGPWMMRGGWTPLWSAFTFPGSAFLLMQVLAVAKGVGLPAVIGTYGSMAVATPLVLFITWRFVMTWVTGELSERSGAAVA